MSDGEALVTAEAAALATRLRAQRDEACTLLRRAAMILAYDQRDETHVLEDIGAFLARVAPGP